MIVSLQFRFELSSALVGRRPMRTQSRNSAHQMARPYANDLRRKFLQAYEQGKGTLGELAEQFGVSEGWAKKISAARTRTGQIERPAWRRGPVSRGDGGGAGVAAGANPQAAGSDAAGITGATASGPGRGLEYRAVVAGLAADGTAAQKKSLHAQEQETPEAQQRRQAWWEAITQIDPEQLVFLEESGASTQMTRNYGRAPGGERVPEGTPHT